MPSVSQGQTFFHLCSENAAPGVAAFDTTLPAPGVGFCWVVDWCYLFSDGLGASDYTRIQMQIFAVGAVPSDGKITDGLANLAAGARVKLYTECPDLRFAENAQVTFRFTCDGANGAAAPVRLAAKVRKIAAVGNGQAS